MDLWQKHKVDHFYRGRSELIWASDAGRYFMPHLQEHVIQWAAGELQAGEPKNTVADLVPQRVGVLEVKNDSLLCVPVSWAQYVQVSKPEIREKLPEDERFHVLCSSCLLKTGDGKLLLSFRSRKVSHYAGVWHISAAGYTDLEGFLQTGNLLKHVQDELEQELNLKPSQYQEPQLLGFVQHSAANVCAIEGCFLTHTSLSSEEVIETAKEARDNWEGKLHVFHESQVRAMLEGDEDYFHAGGAGVLLAALGL